MNIGTGTVVLLVGPKGSGKTYIGRTLERELGIHFIQADDIWLKLKEERKDYGSSDCRDEGFRRMIVAIGDVLKKEPIVCIESTGVGQKKQAYINSLSSFGRVLKIKVMAPLDVCLSRIRQRVSSTHVAMSEAEINKINEEALSLNFSWNLVFHNDPFIPEQEIVRQVRESLANPPLKMYF